MDKVRLLVLAIVALALIIALIIATGRTHGTHGLSTSTPDALAALSAARFHDLKKTQTSV